MQAFKFLSKQKSNRRLAMESIIQSCTMNNIELNGSFTMFTENNINTCLEIKRAFTTPQYVNIKYKITPHHLGTYGPSFDYVMQFTHREFYDIIQEYRNI